ncbi:unnamed protein product [Cyclocybe aegerita]|uniref:F-box domain-containing protein n=1 Tax=Cyclocybe aegerita TaxID=1973307 RepID=A0A8S0WK37_CYCAE|nr:unnamed protein product [Cyclocybe aegerita]
MSKDRGSLCLQVRDQAIEAKVLFTDPDSVDNDATNRRDVIGVLDLPLEVLREIIHQLHAAIRGPSRQYSRLRTSILGEYRLVCKAFNAAVEPIQFATLIFDFHPWQTENQTSTARHLKLIAEGESPASYSTQSLQISCLDPYWKGPLGALNGYTGNWNRDLNATDGSKGADQVSQMVNKYLVKAIASLEILRRVDWYIPKDNRYASSVIDALSNLQGLEELRLTFSDGPFSEDVFQLRKITRLRKLSVYLPRLNDHTDYMKFASVCNEVILANPSLDRLTIVGPLDQLVSMSFHDFLGRFDEVNTLKLLHLRLQNIMLELDAIILPQLSSLTSLDLRNSRRSLDAEAWDLFLSAGIRLTSLSIDIFTRPLLDYLSSFSGLRRLTIQDRHRIPACDDADYLFLTVIPLHKESLKELYLFCTFPCDLSLDWLKGNPLAICPNLTHFGVSLPSDTIEVALEDLRVIISAPRKERLHMLYICRSQLSIGFLCGAGVGRYAMQVQQATQTIVSKWEIDDPQLYPSHICINGREVYHIVRDEVHAGKYRYKQHPNQRKFVIL